VTADGGGLATALRSIEGDEQIARFYAGIVGIAPDVAILERMVNGQPGVAAQPDGVVTVFAFDVEGKHIWTARNPRSSGPGRQADTRTRTAGSAASYPMPGGDTRSDTEIRIYHAGNASWPHQATVPPSQTDMLCALRTY
jgi:hypothetical protein